MRHDKEELVRELRAQWHRFTTRFGMNSKASAGAAFDSIVSHYGQEHRFYHGLAHPSGLIGLLDLTREVKPEWFAHRETDLAIELSLWYHDYEYQIGSAENEDRSAIAVREAAFDLGLGHVATRCGSIVLATNYSKVKEAPADFAACIVRDIDLSPLAARWETFLRNTADLRKESPKGESDKEFLGKRDRFINSVLAQPYIYSTTYFRNLYEDRARSNLTRSLRDPEAELAL